MIDSDGYSQRYPPLFYAVNKIITSLELVDNYGHADLYLMYPGMRPEPNPTDDS